MQTGSINKKMYLFMSLEEQRASHEQPNDTPEVLRSFLPSKLLSTASVIFLMVAGGY